MAKAETEVEYSHLMADGVKSTVYWPFVLKEFRDGLANCGLSVQLGEELTKLWFQHVLNMIEIQEEKNVGKRRRRKPKP